MPISEIFKLLKESQVMEFFFLLFFFFVTEYNQCTFDVVVIFGNAEVYRIMSFRKINK